MKIKFNPRNVKFKVGQRVTNTQGMNKGKDFIIKAILKDGYSCILADGNDGKYYGYSDDTLKAAEAKKECMICGNTKARELELETLYSDGEGNDTEEKNWICKEGRGCSK